MPFGLRFSRQAWPGWVIRAARFGRGIGLRLSEPLDYLVRVANGKRHFPPLRLRRYVGPLASFESSGAEFVAYLKLIAGLLPHESLLDIGCGCGLTALSLRDTLACGGRYLGLDIHEPSIEWCQRSIQRKHAEFEFEWIDVRNITYNPNGKYPAENYAFPVADESFDVALLKSVFTHMRPKEVDNYLREVARVLKPGGRCLVTFFLFDGSCFQDVAHRQSALSFQFGDAIWRYEYENSPDTAAAYSEQFVRDLLAKHRLALRQLFCGTWRGDRSGLSYQDLVFIEKPRTWNTNDG